MICIFRIPQAPPPLPAHWGLPELFELKHGFNVWCCRLCRRYVDDNHIKGIPFGWALCLR